MAPAILVAGGATGSACFKVWHWALAQALAAILEMSYSDFSH